MSLLKLILKERIGVLVQYILLATALQSQGDTTLLGTLELEERGLFLCKRFAMESQWEGQDKQGLMTQIVP